MDAMFNAVKDQILLQGVEKTYWVAYSGGLDSHVLLHLLANLRSVYPLKLRAIHINHGLSPHAAKWTDHAAEVCRRLQVEFVQQQIDAKTENGASPEDIARERRYQALAQPLHAGDILLTAHHQNDQAETVLLQLLRGAGPQGLSAMPRIKPFAEGFHLRPLLDFTRAELEEYAKQHQLCWIDDESNTDTQFTRNFLRHDVMTLLQQRWPTVTNTLARVAENCAENQQLVALMAAEDLVSVRGSAPHLLSVKKLRELNPLRQRQVLRAWLMELHFPLPTAAKLYQLQHDFLQAGDDKLPHISWQNIELRRYRDEIYAQTTLPLHDADQVVEWNLSESLVLENVGVLSAKLVQGQGLQKDIHEVTVRFRQGGEIVQLPGRQCHHELKKLFQMWGVAPWLRDRVPLIYVGDVLAAVVGFFVADEFVAKNNEEGWLILPS